MFFLYLQNTSFWEEEQRELTTKTDGPLHLPKWAYSRFSTGNYHVLKVSSCPMSWALAISLPKGRSVRISAQPVEACLWKCVFYHWEKYVGNRYYFPPYQLTIINLEALEKAGVLSERGEPLGTWICFGEWRKRRCFIYRMRKLNL